MTKLTLTLLEFLAWYWCCAQYWFLVLVLGLSQIKNL